MKKNVGLTDRYVRWFIAMVLVILSGTGVLQGAANWIALVFAVILFVGAWIQFCPLYLPFGINTNKGGKK